MQKEIRNVRKIFFLVNADMSHDDVRLEADERSENLSACATPDNVKKNIKNEMKNTNRNERFYSINADRSIDAGRLQFDGRSENLSAFAEPDNVKKKSGNVKPKVV